MRNLKRALSLALAAIMVLGLMIVGAGAVDTIDFTDSDEIDHTEAVNTMVALNVINGKEDGSYYDPAGTLTRAEMAKIVSYVMNGGVEPVLGTKVTPTYSDIDGHWAEAYIEYCTSMGIIAGDGAGKFNPEGTLTGSQTAKMFLTAMGYNANVFGFTGSNWEVNTNRYANEAGLYEELGDVNPADPISRDDAAQMAYNAIQATMMRRTWSQDMQTGELTETYDLWVDTDGTRHTLLDEKFGAYVAYGQLVKVNKARLTIETDHNYDSKATGSATSFSKLADDYSGLLGETVRVIYKETDNVLAVIPEDSNIVYNVNRSAVEQDDKNVKFGGESYSMEEMTWTSKTNVREDPDQIDYIFVNKNGVATVATKDAGDFAANRSSFNTVKFVDNDDDGVLEYAVEWEVVPGKVTYASSSEIIAGGTTYKLADNNVADGIERDDYVAASYNVFNANYDVVELEKGSAVASVNNKTGADLQYMFDEVWYYRGGNSLTDNVQAGSTYDYWTCNGVIVDTKLNTEGTTLSNLAMVVRTDSTTGVDSRARLLYADGTTATVTVVPDDYSSTDVNFNTLASSHGQLFTVTETSQGYSFKALKAGDKIGNHTYTVGGAVDDDDGNADANHITAVGGQQIADDAVVFVYSGNDKNAKVLNGKQLKNLNASGDNGDIATTAVGYFTNKVDGLTRVSVAAVTVAGTGSLPEGTATYDNFALIVSDAYVTEDSNYFTYEIWDGESMYRVREQGNLTAGMREQFDVITYNSVDENNLISDVVELDQTAAVAGNTAGDLAIAPVYSVSSGKMWISNSTGLDLTDSTVYMYYDSSKTEAADIGKAEGSLIQADPAANGVLMPNVKYIGDGSDVIFVLIDVTNKIVDAKAVGAAGITAANGTLAGNSKITTTFSKTSDIMVGETLTMTVTIAGGETLAAQDLILANAVNAEDGTNVITIPSAISNTGTEAITRQFSVVATTASNAVSVAQETADMSFDLTTPAPGTGNSISVDQDARTVTVNVVNGTSSVTITGTRTANQTANTIGGTDSSDVTPTDSSTSPTYAVNTTGVSSGGSKTFTLTVKETNHADVIYTVTVTVAGA